MPITLSSNSLQKLILYEKNNTLGYELPLHTASIRISALPQWTMICMIFCVHVASLHQLKMMSTGKHSISDLSTSNTDTFRNGDLSENTEEWYTA